MHEGASYSHDVGLQLIFSRAMKTSTVFRTGFLLVTVLWVHVGWAQSAADSELHLYRPKKALSCALKASIFINDSMEVRLTNNEHQVVLLPAGHCRLTTRKNDLIITLASDEPAFIRVGYDFNFLFGKLEMVEVTPDFAATEIGHIEAGK